ncbi:MAG: hypothetical protein QOH22_96 [Gemmatimonadaceae bacterium]|nr:hypothetical protein [Gemmatimonadaceae bacterium]
MRRLRLCAASIIVGMAALATPSTGAAQCTVNGVPGTCNQPGSVSITAGRVIRLQVSAGSTALSAPTPTDFDAGFNSTTGPSLTVSANAAWTLHVRASSALWTATNTSPGAPARTTKPAADLKWSTGSNGTFNALTTTDALLVGGSATASNATTLYFQTLYNWTLDTPGNYSLAVILTLTSP